MRLRDVGATLLAASLGAVFAAGAGGKMFAPQSWFWPLVVVCGGAGLAVLGVAIGWARRPALDLVFDRDDERCLYQFTGDSGYGYMVGTHWTNTPEPMEIASQLTGASAAVTTWPAASGVYGGGRTAPLVQAPHTLVRLRVENRRSRALDGVRVSVVEARHADGTPAHLHPDLLKWMHDDDGARVRSQQGDTLEPGTSPRAYIDLATKNHLRDGICLEFTQPHLRNLEILGAPVLVHVMASGRDSDGPVPSRHRAFQIDVGADGGLRVSPVRLPLQTSR